MDYASTDVLPGFREKSYGLMCTKPAVTPMSLQDTISKQCPKGGDVRRSCVAIMVQKMALLRKCKSFCPEIIHSFMEKALPSTYRNVLELS